MKWYQDSTLFCSWKEKKKNNYNNDDDDYDDDNDDDNGDYDDCDNYSPQEFMVVGELALHP